MDQNQDDFLKNIKESEEKFRSIFINIPQGVALHRLIFDEHEVPLDYIILEINPSFEKILGLPGKDVIGKTSREAYQVSIPPYLDIYAKVAMTGESIIFETYFLPLKKYFSISVYRPFINSFVTIFEDISTRKQSEKELQVSLAKYKVLFDSFPVGITISDSNGKIIESNHQADKLLGLSEDEQKQRTIGGKDWRIIRTDGTPMPSSEFASVRAQQEQQPVENIEMGIVKGESQATWINVSAAPIPLEGYGVAIIYNEITEQKQAKDLLRETNAYLENLINYANAPIIVWDPEFRITRFNHAFEFITGYTEQEVFGKSLELLFPSELVEDSMALIHKTLSGEHWETVEIKIRHRDGSLKTVLWNSATIFTSDGQVPIATIAQGQDITIRKKAEEALKKSEENQRRINAEKDKFFSILAHDLRNPFNTFLGFTQIMADELPAMTLDQIQKMALSMRKSANSLYNLLNNLLEWSRLQRGITTYTPVSFSLLPALAESLESVRETAHKKGVEINFDIPENLEIFADLHMIQIILRNLASNAVKYTDKGGRIDINVLRNPDRSVSFQITDTGIGMSKEIKSHLFWMDQNTNRPGTEGEPSTGLGLIICKEFIEKHGGKMMIESEEGKGSTFMFSLPQSG